MDKRKLKQEVDMADCGNPQEPLPSANSFVLYPLAKLPSGSRDPQRVQQCIYQIAWEHARVMARPSLPERDLLGVGN
jgi:hypothetical protein